MANIKFVSLDNLTRTINAIKSKFVAAVPGKGLSTNDFTTADKNNLGTAYTHSQSAHAPSDAQVNVIEEIKVNGAKQSVAGKSVDISVPVQITDLENNADYQTGTQQTAAINAALVPYSTTEDMNAEIQKAVAGLASGGLKTEVVEVLPDFTHASADTIYLILQEPAADPQSKNIYDEWMVINSAWEKIGSTDIDMTGYVKTEDMIEATNDEIDALFK